MLASVIARMRSLWHGIRRRPELEAEMSEEFRSHLELRAADLVHSGLSPADAQRQARLEFGALEQYKDQGREARGLRRIDAVRFSWLDFKLGFRMLVRYPGLTLVGGLAIAFGIWVGAGVFEFITQAVAPNIPLSQGDRIVTLQNWSAAESRVESRSLHDFARWRSDLRFVEEVGAYRPLVRNLIPAGGTGAPVEVAEISAVAFRLTRVPPFPGRTLIDADEQVGAAPVVVIGYDVWQARFAGDSNIVGRTVRLSGEAATVVGVMPPGYAFPIAHSVWTPLRLNPLDYQLLEGPGIKVFARLAPGFSIDQAQAELTSLGQRLQHDLPLVRQHLRPQVKPYAKSSQVGLGVLAGAVLIVFLGGATVRVSPMSLAIVAGYSVLMMAVCLLACIVPTHRALRVQPTDALRSDG
ncbi:MAG: ABC transporter permease [Gemmatimonadaceae bacterium]